MQWVRLCVDVALTPQKLGQPSRSCLCLGRSEKERDAPFHKDPQTNVPFLEPGAVVKPQGRGVLVQLKVSYFVINILLKCVYLNPQVLPFPSPPHSLPYLGVEVSEQLL